MIDGRSGCLVCIQEWKTKDHLCVYFWWWSLFRSRLKSSQEGIRGLLYVYGIHITASFVLLVSLGMSICHNEDFLFMQSLFHLMMSREEPLKETLIWLTVRKTILFRSSHDDNPPNCQLKLNLQLSDKRNWMFLWRNNSRWRFWQRREEDPEK